MSDIKSTVQRLGSYLGEVGVEFKKVSWPDKQELVDSTYVVIAFIVILAVTTLCCDKVIQFVLQLIIA
ncbi:MAG: preprotein translocase subunit SecE [Kiritimatiellae bacterium]|jgi:preprotein translocase SecE subunit|nr:preprotein translocase subunit SecE [Kiritimatiellia bacterium]